ncbi:hypothetical protein H072_5585 [Dactylellina haptotyla CBS 200.50]|uniref:Uncharacterized protein n=1 Tax=Dactylellina haptotyla (strain CBS 200.50) TaxID=1284197 RepID=S8AHB2_DACHA|nr:hypothetical protein H072_5585 [Dactylellina haptotyla CBS 200.50]
MSVAFPNPNPVGQNAADSFSASAAFSFDQHNPTPLFGQMNTDPQTQMQNQMHITPSLSVPMVTVSHGEFSSDHDMANAPRDEDFDVDLDIDQYDDDGDMNLDDLATPMATAEDDFMAEATNVPTPNPLFGQTMEQANDEEMVDDALGQVVNEVMLDADQPELASAFNFQALQSVQQGQQQQQQQQQQRQLQPQIHDQPAEQPQSQPTAASQPAEPTTNASDNAAPLVSPVSPTPFQEYPEAEGQSAAVEQPVDTVQPEDASAHGPAQAETATSQLQQATEEPHTTASPTVEVVEPSQPSQPPTDTVTPPPKSPTHLESSGTPQNKNLEVLKHQTPPSSADALRISQADTVPLENPTPEVGQREWYLAGMTQPEDQGAPASPPAPKYTTNHEIPTSPLQEPSGEESAGPSFHSELEIHSPQPSQHSNHESHIEQASQPSHAGEEQAYDESAQQSVEEDSHTESSTEDPLLNHPVVIVYRDLEFSLFPVVGEHTKLPETSFLPDRSHIGSPLSKLVASLRDVLGEEFHASEEIVLNFTALGVEFEEENVQMNDFTLYDIIGLFSKLTTQDGISEIQPLYISLTSRKRYIPKLEIIHSHIVGGGGLAAWKQVLEGRGKNQIAASEHQNEDKKPSQIGMQGQATSQVTNPHEKPIPEQEIEHDDDEELELEDFEKEYEAKEEEPYYSTETHDEEHEPEAHAANVDVPKSPSQASIDRHKPALIHGNSNVDGSLNIPETQYSQLASPHASTNEQPSIAVDQEFEASLNRDDETSFVTAREKPQDTSVVQSYSGPRSYGLPATPSEHEEEDFENEGDEPSKGMEHHTFDDGEEGEIDGNQIDNPDTYDYELLTSLDDGILNFEDQEAETDEQPTRLPDEDTKSSSTLHEAPESEEHVNAALETDQQNGHTDQANDWNGREWAYVEDDEANIEEYEYEEEGNAQDDISYPEMENEAPHDLAESTELIDEEELDLDAAEFAYYPVPFSPSSKKPKSDEHEDDESLFGLEHETFSTTASTAKRAREDDEEDEDELSDDGEIRSSPIPASKKHKTT